MATPFAAWGTQGTTFRVPGTNCSNVVLSGTSRSRNTDRGGALLHSVELRSTL
jgi:hypothetical protein